MGWTITDWTTNPDWAAVANMNDFDKAVDERYRILDQRGTYFGLANFVPGDDAQNHQTFEDWQEAIETSLVGRWPGFLAIWARSHDGGVPRAADYYDALDAFEVMNSLALAFDATDLAHVNWRRYTTHPDDAGGVMYGQCQAGDIIGPWLFEDLQKVLNVMVWTHRDCGWWATDPEWYLGEGIHPTVWATAKALAEADWHGPIVAGFVGGIGAFAAGSFGGMGPDYYASCARYRSHAMPSGAGVYPDSVCTTMARDIRWFMYTEGWLDYDWHDHGDPVFEDAWQCWSVDSPSHNDAQPRSLTYPTGTGVLTDWPAEPNGGSTIQGWLSGFANRCLIQWDVVDGLEYV